MRMLALIVGLLGLANLAFGAIKVEEIEYKVGSGDQVFRGFMAYDDTAKDRRPGVLVCHEWWGCNEYAASRAKQLAELGYVAFAVDMYGKGNVTTDPKQAGEWAGKATGDVKLLRERAEAGLAVLSKSPRVDSNRLAAIGYCMGGTVALELARGGADLKAVVAFHAGGLLAKNAADNKNIKAKVLICHGGDDKFVKDGDLAKFEAEMKDAKVEYTLNTYPGALHAFTNPEADKFNIPGVKYQEAADKKSWKDMQELFDKVLKKR